MGLKSSNSNLIVSFFFDFLSIVAGDANVAESADVASPNSDDILEPSSFVAAAEDEIVVRETRFTSDIFNLK